MLMLGAPCSTSSERGQKAATLRDYREQPIWARSSSRRLYKLLERAAATCLFPQPARPARSECLTVIGPSPVRSFQASTTLLFDASPLAMTHAAYLNNDRLVLLSTSDPQGPSLPPLPM